VKNTTDGLSFLFVVVFTVDLLAELPLFFCWTAWSPWAGGRFGKETMDGWSGVVERGRCEKKAIGHHCLVFPLAPRVLTALVAFSVCLGLRGRGACPWARGGEGNGWMDGEVAVRGPGDHPFDSLRPAFSPPALRVGAGKSTALGLQGGIRSAGRRDGGGQPGMEDGEDGESGSKKRIAHSRVRLAASPTARPSPFSSSSPFQDTATPTHAHSASSC
jgi:hypothetical protein